MTEAAQRPVLGFATQGAEHLDGRRLRTLLEGVDAEMLPFDRAHKLRSARALFAELRRRRPQLVVMEGTGLGGGLVLLLARRLLGIPYVFSSGDAVGPYLALDSRVVGAIATRYERALYRHCAGFVGWTPYLAGRAMTFGAPRAMTAAGWSQAQPSPGARAAVRARLGIAADALVIGIVGTLNWRERLSYCYGAELVRAVARVRRRDIVACVIGDGNGRGRLQELAGPELGSRVLLPGRVPPEQVADHLAAFDLASLPQSVDAVGSFRYSTKLSEFFGAGLPVVTGQTPAAYDLDEGFIWRLPGPTPWSETYVDALAGLLDSLTAQELERRRAALAERRLQPFDMAAQQRRMQAFVEDILAARSRG